MRGTQSKHKPMKNLKFLTSLFILTLVCITFTSCSDDDKDNPSTANLEGVWICTESTYNDGEDIPGSRPFSVGDGMKLMNQSFTSIDKLVSGKMCFLLYDGRWYDVEPDVTGEPTLKDWLDYRWYIEDEEELEFGYIEEFGYIYSLNGNKLSIMQCDLDRTVGTISIDGNTLTYTYTYQDWTYGPNIMVSESKTFISKFEKK